MCYSTALEREEKALERDYNRRMLESSRAAYLHPDELDENYEPDRSILFKQTSAFARPYWPVISTANPTVIDVYRWGHLPAHIKSEEQAKDYLRKYSTFNAVSEEVATKSTYKAAWAKGQRCLVPVTSFYEWQHVPIPGRKTVKKVPYRIGTDQEVFSLAGIWEDSALGYRTYTILTTTANPLMAEIHNSKQRMPVIIPKALEETWLSAGLTPEEAKALCTPFPQEHMRAVKKEEEETPSLF